MIAEYKKFMYLVALEVQQRKRERRIEGERVLQDVGDKKWVFQSPFCAPPYLDRMWRTLILYNNDYAEFCKKLCSGFIDRDDPRENFPAAFQRYNALLASLERHQSLLKPFKNLWPKYDTIEEFMTDYEYTSYVSADGLNTLIGYMN